MMRSIFPTNDPIGVVATPLWGVAIPAGTRKMRTAHPPSQHYDAASSAVACVFYNIGGDVATASLCRGALSLHL